MYLTGHFKVVYDIAHLNTNLKKIHFYFIVVNSYFPRKTQKKVLKNWRQDFSISIQNDQMTAYCLLILIFDVFTHNSSHRFISVLNDAYNEM